MTTDELLLKLPSHIGRNRANGFYLSDHKAGASIGWLQLVNDGRDWEASYRDGHDALVCLNPDALQPPYNNAFAIGDTPNEALQRLYDWCVNNDFIKE